MKSVDSGKGRFYLQHDLGSLNGLKISLRTCCLDLSKMGEPGRRLTKLLSTLSGEIWDAQALLGLNHAETVTTQSHWQTWRFQTSLEQLHAVALILNLLSTACEESTGPSCA